MRRPSGGEIAAEISREVQMNDRRVIPALHEVDGRQ
jgi:hypothetical protein